MTKYVLGFCFDMNLDKLLLIRKEKPAFMKGRLNGIGGHVEEGEEFYEAMVREFREETGIELTKNWHEFSRLHYPDEVIVCYAVRTNKWGQFYQTTTEKVIAFDVDKITKLQRRNLLCPNVAWLSLMAKTHLQQKMNNLMGLTL